jgi:hypothetical protein
MQQVGYSQGRRPPSEVSEVGHEAVRRRLDRIRPVRRFARAGASLLQDTIGPLWTFHSGPTVVRNHQTEVLR